MAASAAAQAIELPSRFSARYEVTHLGLALGESRIVYEEFDGGRRYRYSSEARTVGLASLFSDAAIEERSEGKITDSGYLPMEYYYERSGDESREARLLFDWQDNVVTNDVAGHAWRMAIPEGAKDRMVTQLQLMHDLASDERELVYQVADGGRLKTYTLKVIGREPVKTPYGRFETLKITEVRDDNERATTFWVAPALDYLAVRIEHREDDDTFRMTLEELEGFGLEKPAPEFSPFGITLSQR